MSELIDNLNYDYNYNMFLAKLALPNLNKMEGKRRKVKLQLEFNKKSRF